MATIKITIDNIKCDRTAGFVTRDDIYYVSTLNCGFSTDRQVQDPITLRRITRTSESIDIGDGETASFPPPQDVVFQGDCNPEQFVSGSVYFFNQRGDQEVKQKDLIARSLGFLFGSLAGIFPSIALGVLAALAAGGGTLGLLVGIAALFGGLGGSALAGLGIVELVNSIIAVFTRDEYIGAVAFNVPVSGPSGTQPVPGSAFRLNSDTRGITINDGPTLPNMVVLRFSGVTFIDYSISFSVTR
ncbi:MAG: hypothetical protein WAM70_03955 [Pyrinomonadaceae bacterium]